MKRNLALFFIAISTQLVLTSPLALAGSGLWKEASSSSRAKLTQLKSGAYYQLDHAQITQLLSRADLEGNGQQISEIELPVGKGQIQRFKLFESPIMAPELAARYPEIKNYKVYGIDNPHASGRLSNSPMGFSGMITSPEGSYFIDPADKSENAGLYRAWRRASNSKSSGFKCGVEGHTHDHPVGEKAYRAASRTPGSLRVYRLALAATTEYVSAVGGTGTVSARKAQTLIEVNNAISRVNQIYEVDLGVRLQLVADTDSLFYTGVDPYTNDSGIAMLTQNQTNINTVIGAPNYDIGHVFSTGGGGLASLGSVCGTSKAEGVTGLGNPVGEDFYIDFVAHEMGHQFSAEHTFNGTTGNCGGGNRVAASAFEPGSGSTIMSYAGICGTTFTVGENITLNADAMFHSGSIAAIDTFTTSGAGSGCGNPISNANPSEPIVNAGSDYTIPRKTPFMLMATGSDADGDTLSYSWDQMDAGAATANNTLGFDLTTNSLFRSYLPQADNMRHFPALGTTIKNQFDTSETLACKTRSLNFRVSVRDGKSGIGRDDVVVNVVNAAGPFEITSHGSSQNVLSGPVTVIWNVANTDAAPISCSNVDISLLTFNGSEKTSYYETMLSSNEVNDGTATVTIPGNFAQVARFKVQCSDNIFYDISNADLSINGGVLTNFPTADNTVAYNTAGIGFTLSSVETEQCTDASTSSGGGTTTPTNTAGTSTATTGGSSGSAGLLWILSMLSIALYSSARNRERMRKVTAKIQF